MAAGRRVATGNIATDQANPQLDRTLAGTHALITCLATGFHLVVGLLQVFAIRHVRSPDNCFWMNYFTPKIHSRAKPFADF